MQKSHQMMEMILKLQAENEKLKKSNNEDSQESCPKFAQLEKKSNEKEVPPIDPSENYYANEPANFQMDSMQSDPTSEPNQQTQVENFKKSHISLTESEAKRVNAQLDSHFKEIDEFLKKNTPSKGSQQDSQQIPQFDSNYRNDIAMKRKASDGGFTFMNSAGQDSGNPFAKKANPTEDSGRVPEINKELQ
jgi:hypothetical protein